MAAKNMTVEVKPEVVKPTTPAPAALAVPAPAQVVQGIDFEALLAQHNAAFASVMSAKDADFEAEAKDFWKPTTIGESVKGVYLGREKAGGDRFYSHKFAVPHPKTGKPMLLSMNGSRILSKELAKGEEGQGVKVIFQGQTVTQAGQKLNQYDVLWARK